MKNCLLILILTFTACSTCKKSGDNPSNVIEIENGGIPLRQMMYLNKEHWTMELNIPENTLNDTAMLGGNVHIPPGKTGLLMKGDCFMDSLPFIYQPYRATKGRLVVQYSSRTY